MRYRDHGERPARAEGERLGKLTDGLSTHESGGDGSGVDLVLLIPLGLDLTTRAVGEETSDHLKVGAELTNSLCKPNRRCELVKPN